MFPFTFCQATSSSSMCLSLSCSMCPSTPCSHDDGFDSPCRPRCQSMCKSASQPMETLLLIAASITYSRKYVRCGRGPETLPSGSWRLAKLRRESVEREIWSFLLEKSDVFARQTSCYTHKSRQKIALSENNDKDRVSKNISIHICVFHTQRERERDDFGFLCPCCLLWCLFMLVLCRILCVVIVDASYKKRNSLVHFFPFSFSLFFCFFFPLLSKTHFHLLLSFFLSFFFMLLFEDHRNSVFGVHW